MVGRTETPPLSLTDFSLYELWQSSAYKHTHPCTQMSFFFLKKKKKKVKVEVGRDAKDLPTETTFP